MQNIRILGEGRCFYHCVSRVVDRRFIFGEKEKAFFHKTMRKLEAFLEIRVVTYCLMSNHFHLLLEIPDPELVEKLDVEELLRRLSLLYSKDEMLDVTDELKRANGDPVWTQKILDRFQRRIGRLDCFMKELKQRFSIWYNRNNNRKGTLWEERFKSVLVQDYEKALITMAAYIDLNPVRAGMVEDPKDYRWCGYGEAMGGGAKARQGLGLLLEESLRGERMQSNWNRTGSRYRMILYDKGREVTADGLTVSKNKRGFDSDAAEEIWEKDGQLSRAEILRCRVRYFCDGAVFGTAEFVDAVFERNRALFGAKRKTGARKMRGADWQELRVMRDLRTNLIKGTSKTLLMRLTC